MAIHSSLILIAGLTRFAKVCISEYHPITAIRRLPDSAIYRIPASIVSSTGNRTWFSKKTHEPTTGNSIPPKTVSISFRFDGKFTTRAPASMFISTAWANCPHVSVNEFSFGSTCPRYSWHGAPQATRRLRASYASVRVVVPASG